MHRDPDFRARRRGWRTHGLALLFAVIAPAALFAANWPNWRGPNLDGTTATAHDLPVTWGPDRNIKWQREMPAWSGSSPTVWADRIFLNSPAKEPPAPPAPEPATTSGRKRPNPGASRGLAMNGPGGQEILLLCLSRATGRELWRRQYDQGNRIQMKHNMSSPTPISDGRHVWVGSGNGVIACFDFEGREQWKFDLVKHYGSIGTNFGYGSSPLLLDGKLIVQVLHGMKTDEPSYLFALDAASGRVLWRVERPTDAERETPDAYTTPTVVPIGGRNQIVISGGGYVTGHDPESGVELWRGGGLNPTRAGNFRVIASPVVHDGIIYVPTRQVPLLAYRPGGQGDITATHLVWKWTGRGGPDVPTPVCDGPRLYLADDAGAITCLDAKTGALIYGPHDTGIGRTSASPILADGKLHLVSETGETAVIQAGPEYKLLARNALDGTYTLSTPAIADGEIFLRTGTHLYCIANAAANSDR